MTARGPFDRGAGAEAGCDLEVFMVEALKSRFFFATLFQKLASMSTKLLSKSLLCKSGSPQSGSLRAVIFDLDGTLIDTAGDLAASMNHVLVANGVNAIPPGDVRHLVGFGARAMLEIPR